tara:strand:+ start:12055 stop:12327 length:273 start_codon:yes stop_codon:yes gene_type:complete
MTEEKKVNNLELQELFEAALKSKTEIQTLSVKDVENILGCSRWTIYRLIDDGLLVAMQSMARGKIRFTAKALQDYIKSTQINPKKKKEVS